MKESVNYWLEIADYDYETAKVMLSGGRYLYVGFMCHQVIEKALKAAISRDCEEGQIPPKIHHLLKLANLAGLYAKMTTEQQSFLKELNPMNIEARYPEYKKQIAAGLSKNICDQILKGTGEMFCWIKEQL